MNINFDDYKHLKWEDEKFEETLYTPEEAEKVKKEYESIKAGVRVYDVSGTENKLLVAYTSPEILFYFEHGR